MGSLNDKIEISASKTKLVKLFFFSVLFLLIGLWLLIKNPQSSNPIMNNIFFKIIGSISTTCMGLIGVYFFGKQIFNKKPSIILSEQGIFLDINTFKFDLIPWSEITHVYENIVNVSNSSKQNFITIGVKSPDKYISLQSNMLKGKLLNSNSFKFGSPIHFSTSNLDIKHQDLLDLIREYFEEYKQMSNKIE